MTTTPATTSAPSALFANHTDRELLAVNGQYLREYREDPTPERLTLVNRSSIALSERGL